MAFLSMCHIREPNIVSRQKPKRKQIADLTSYEWRNSSCEHRHTRLVKHATTVVVLRSINTCCAIQSSARFERLSSETRDYVLGFSKIPGEQPLAYSFVERDRALLATTIVIDTTRLDCTEAWPSGHEKQGVNIP